MQIKISFSLLVLGCTIVLGVRNFYIDYERDTFVKDGQDFRYISGSIHYFRVLEPYWNDVLRKARLMGLNAITTYIEWSSHQPSPTGRSNFEENLNVFKFLEIAQANNLSVILRPGPFIDAERDMGGLPPWLLWQKPGIKLRSSDPEFVYFVSRWFDDLLPRLKPFLYQNGGPIIMMQVENEYGSVGCDKNYTTFLRDLIRFHLGPDLVLFTTDGAVDKYVKCGNVPKVYPTVDFGPKTSKMVNQSFVVQRKFAPKGPLINSEYYSGWLDHWRKPHNTRNSSTIVNTLDTILSLGANVNIYMFHGGTSFGYKAGSNRMFDVCSTSYDYDAPLSESRDPTTKYFDIKKSIEKFMPVPEENPVVTPKQAYGKVNLQAFTSILDPEFMLSFSKPPVISNTPKFFEEMKIGSGFVLYESKIDFLPPNPVLLTVDTIKDRGYVYVDEMLAGVLSRTENISSLPLLVSKGQKIRILVENQGRISHGAMMGENKGLGKNVTLGTRRLKNWTMYPVGEIEGHKLLKYSTNTSKNFLNSVLHTTTNSKFYVGKFKTNQMYPPDTFVDLTGFSKGFVWINGFNLGRYWPVIGPQKTLYLPGALLYPKNRENTIIVLELQSSPAGCLKQTPAQKEKCFITLTDTHIIDSPTPYP